MGACIRSHKKHDIHNWQFLWYQTKVFLLVKSWNISLFFLLLRLTDNYSAHINTMDKEDDDKTQVIVAEELELLSSVLVMAYASIKSTTFIIDNSCGIKQKCLC